MKSGMAMVRIPPKARHAYGTVDGHICAILEAMALVQIRVRAKFTGLRLIE